ncbi:Ig-like domain-containing protein, partial [Flavobacterium sp. W21_SRS_FM7]
MTHNYSNFFIKEEKKFQKYFLFIVALFTFFTASAQKPVFNNPTLIFGKDRTEGSKYLYEKVSKIDGNDIDAVVTITDISNASIIDVDNSKNGNGLYLDRFQPVITINGGYRSSGGYVEFLFEFFKSGTRVPVKLDSFALEAIDVDGNEYFEAIIEKPAYYKLENPTKLEVNTTVNSPFTRFQGPTESINEISIKETKYIAVVHYPNSSSAIFRLGSWKNSSSRQSSISFGEVVFDYPDPPVANDDSKLNQEAGVVSLNVVSNDSDPNNNLDISTVDLIPSANGIQTSLVVPNEGTWSVVGNGFVKFTPLSSFQGDPTPIKYTVNDTTNLTSNQATITITYAPKAPISGGDQKVCTDGTTSQKLTATATVPSGVTITWYNAAVDGQIVSNPVQVGVGSVIYYAQANKNSAYSLTRTAVKLTISPASSAAISGGNQTVCSDGTTTQKLTATATGETITWYTSPTGGTAVSSPTQVGVGTKIYYAQNYDGTCPSLTRTAVTLTINETPGSPTASDVEYCQDDTAVALTATASNTKHNLVYFTSLTSTGQSSLIPSTSTAGTYTYYVAEESNSCFGPKKAITVKINPKVTITTQPINRTVVFGLNTTFSVVASNVTSYQWQVDSGSGFTNITNDSFYSDATTSTLTVSKPTVAMSTYRYRAILVGIGNCSNVITNIATLTVTPKAVTVVAADKSKVYGDTNPAL